MNSIFVREQLHHTSALMTKLREIAATLDDICNYPSSSATALVVAINFVVSRSL
ncbi:hypothetical protein [Calothrix sp. CCY 0018]|uniref:hypothetical protein n=1 Tax=Calothrix sp. CCY 0018 TaxID=3103864 RepID=UPI0039C72501